MPIWCPACQEEHPARAFNRESRKYSGLHGVCREAQARARQTPEGRQATVRRNKRRWEDPDYREKSREWNRNRRRRLGTSDLKKARTRLAKIVHEWKSEGCVDCGYRDIRAIDPDHVDPQAKSENISRMITMCASEERLREELAKCVPRCVRCHRKVTARQHPSKLRDMSRLPASWQQKLDYQDRIDLFKLALGCYDCGWKGWARGLDFDHVRGIKTNSVSNLIGRGRIWEVVFNELLKCECVCANCHRLRTLERGQYYQRKNRSGNDGGDGEVA